MDSRPHGLVGLAVSARRMALPVVRAGGLMGEGAVIDNPDMDAVVVALARLVRERWVAERATKAKRQASLRVVEGGEHS